MSDRFDELARAVAEPSVIGRRKMLRRTLAAVGFGAGATMLGGEAASAASAAKPNGGTNCPPGLTACGSVCRDLTSNSDNCGVCGTSCPTDSVCRNGTCVQVTCTCQPTCPTGQAWCSGACVDTSSSNTNCGTCGTVCASGTTCSNGTCVKTAQCTSSADCPPSTNPCQTAVCTSGTCGFANAPAGTACTGGTCDGNGICASCTSDSQCPSGHVCQSGVCVQGCPTGQTLCNGVCVNTSTDVSNCGTCGTVCSTANGTSVCSNGTCAIQACNAGWANCNGNPADGCETNTASDPNNCGACGNVCSSGKTCSLGSCV